MRLILAEGLGFEPSHNDFRDRRATVTLALSIFVPVCPGCQASFRFVSENMWYKENTWYPRWDSNPHWKDFKSSVSTCWTISP